ncbi:hypothetical protein BDP27DRAFT_1358912 [Rhodocollybia butyracea]|uniref:Uncharacterized protein n=1 Tax=Rhodocollybia butyracea TaxID=206335 RepID=A0A9P5UDH3_9AGAR|nr:hypothetical protein BDP27DRAFT_1358912 [Rhodocollybia butyracea]
MSSSNAPTTRAGSPTPSLLANAQPPLKNRTQRQPQNYSSATQPPQYQSLFSASPSDPSLRGPPVGPASLSHWWTILKCPVWLHYLLGEIAGLLLQLGASKAVRGHETHRTMENLIQEHQRWVLKQVVKNQELNKRVMEVVRSAIHKLVSSSFVSAASFFLDLGKDRIGPDSEERLGNLLTQASMVEFDVTNYLRQELAPSDD